MEAADNNMYEIEIKEVDVAAQRLKIHFKVYDEKFDEWRPFTDGSLPFVTKIGKNVSTKHELASRTTQWL